jgi:cell wall assembly regulator SMI1
MESLVMRLRAALEALQPGLSAHLRPGVSEAGLAGLEGGLGLRLPDDVRAFYRQVDGQSPDGPGLWEGTELLSAERILDEWTVWKDLLERGDFVDVKCDPDPGVKDDWWNAKWVPLTYNGSGDHHCLDLDPGVGGRNGQVIEMWHDEPTRPLVAPAFRKWLTNYCDGLERGEYVFSDEYFAVVPKSDLA